MLFSLLFLSGCPVSKKYAFDNRNIQSIELGGISRKNQLLEENENVESVSGFTKELITSFEFSFLSSDYSFGLLPYTGRTKHLRFKHLDGNQLYCNVIVSKYQYKVVFIEVEKEPQTDIFLTTNAQKEEVGKLVEKLKDFAEKQYPSKSINIIANEK